MVHEQREALQQEERLSPEVVAFCALIARIMMRCLSQQDTRMRKVLSLPSQAERRDTGAEHDPAAASPWSPLTNGYLRKE
jgi:hypothetical protein